MSYAFRKHFQPQNLFPVEHCLRPGNHGLPLCREVLLRTVWTFRKNLWVCVTASTYSILRNTR